MKRKKQQEIFDTWLSKNRELLFKVTRSYAFTPEDRDDLFQEVCLQVWKSIPGFRARCAVSTWLYRIALNTAIKWSTKEKKQIKANEQLDSANTILSDSALKKDEKVEWLYEEIAKLEPIDRSITLLLLDGFSYKEMASIVGISESNIGVKIHRVKKILTKNAKNYNNV